MAQTNTKDLSRQEWLMARRKGIGGSDVAAILGLSKWKTPLQVWEDKTSTMMPPDDPAPNPRMKAGVKLEEVVAEWFTEETGYTVIRDNKIRYHKQLPYLLANVDRIIIPNNGEGRGILEIKTTSGYAAKNWETDVPLEYYCQIQHYMNVLGYSWGYLAVLIDGWDFRHIYIPKDPEFIRIMESRLDEFWECVQNGIPPLAKTDDDFQTLYPTAEGELEAAPETAGIVEIIKEKTANLKELETELETLKHVIKLAMADKEVLTYNGAPIVKWKFSKAPETIDTKALRATMPEIAAQFTKTGTPSRRFTIL